jgi:tRNA threonylcarbamoyladenosine biosynthesis protein TsaE
MRARAWRHCRAHPLWLPALLASRPSANHAGRSVQCSLSTAADGAWRPLPTVRDTQQLAARLAALCRAGDTLLLFGDYGSGKTCFAQGFIKAWLREPEGLYVTSPSYLIDNTYPDEDGSALQPGVTVHHMDLWRLPQGKVGQLVDLPHIFSECVSLIEWPERLVDNEIPARAGVLELHLRLDESAAAEADDPVAAAEAVEEGRDLPRWVRLVPRGQEWEQRLQALSAMEGER